MQGTRQLCSSVRIYICTYVQKMKHIKQFLPSQPSSVGTAAAFLPGPLPLRRLVPRPESASCRTASCWSAWRRPSCFRQGPRRPRRRSRHRRRQLLVKWCGKNSVRKDTVCSVGARMSVFEYGADVELSACWMDCTFYHRISWCGWTLYRCFKKDRISNLTSFATAVIVHVVGVVVVVRCQLCITGKEKNDV